MLLAICGVLGVLWLLYHLWTERYNYWKARNFPYIQPTFPFGNMKDMVLFLRYQGHVHQDIYKEGEPHPYVGVFSMRRPFLFIRDPEIVKHVMVKDFNNFRDRIVTTRTHPLSEHLFNLSGDRWRGMRVKLTPTFTSGKLKTMYAHFHSCAQQLDIVLQKKAAAGQAVNIKDVAFRFTCDLIGTCAFGLELNTLNKDDDMFRQIGQLIFPTETPTSVKLKLAILLMVPGIDRLLRFKFFPNIVTEFVMGVVKDTVEFREKNNIRRNDFLDLLIELKNKKTIDSDIVDIGDNQEKTEPSLEMTMDLLSAQCFVFLVAGFETSSSVQSYCMYELSQNPEIQERLREEIDEVTAKHGGELTYQAIQEMTYLDQVVSETMRKYPTLPFLNRTCSKRYRMPDSGLEVEEGTRLIIPVYALHHDPQYYPDPERFDPDRFSAERKSTIHPYTYLPFGEGPRLCIGMRFGLLQTKTGICTVLRKYKVTPSTETKVPLTFSCSLLVTTSQGPIMLKIEPRPPKKA